ncbi:DUF4276 family protein [Myxococcota bacterium]|nr:DUF4276 family protein [Myxococcota bacterium]
MKTLVFFLEEPSAQDALEGLLPRILPDDIKVHYLIFEGKQDLEKRMESRMRAWRAPHSLFVILRDQDRSDCKNIKKNLLEKCKNAGQPTTLVRIACRELEAWFVGDWRAVGEAFDLTQKLSSLAKKARYRDPDKLDDPVAELRRYLPYYQKRDGARRIGRHLDINRNKSKSFQIFIDGIKKLTTTIDSSLI